MRDLIDLWVGTQTWLFETLVSPVALPVRPDGTGTSRPSTPSSSSCWASSRSRSSRSACACFERRWPLEKPGKDDGLIGVDRVYTVLNKLGIVPLAIFIVTYPLIQRRSSYLVRIWGFAPPRLERLAALAARQRARSRSCVYFVLYDFAAYWLHRAQHAFGWWWALHSLHHSQRRMTVWTDDRNHVVDDLLVTLVLVVFAQFVGVQPDEYRPDPDGRPPGRELVACQRRHELRLAGRAPAGRPALPPPAPRAGRRPTSAHIHDHNFAPVFPIWDILFGTAIYDEQAPPDRRRRCRASTPTTAAAGSPSR